MFILQKQGGTVSRNGHQGWRDNHKALTRAPCQRKGDRGIAPDETDARPAETLLGLHNQKNSRTKEPKSGLSTTERSKAFRPQTQSPLNAEHAGFPSDFVGKILLHHKYSS